MKRAIFIALTVCFPFDLGMVTLRDISFVGIWTDILFSIILVLTAILITSKYQFEKSWLIATAKGLNMVCSIGMILMLFSFINSPYYWDKLKSRSFCYQSINDHLYHAYFMPVGAYSGGEGNFWITESPQHFPFIEWSVYYERAILHDFSEDTFDGSPIDNEKIARDFIKEKVSP